MMKYVLVDEVMKLYEFSFVPSVHQYLLKSHSIKEICLYLHFIQLCKEDYELLTDSC